eukprot:scaffold481025_cov17-Prasinocladus_malaysianus.AAC.1
MVKSETSTLSCLHMALACLWIRAIACLNVLLRLLGSTRREDWAGGRAVNTLIDDHIRYTRSVRVPFRYYPSFGITPFNKWQCLRSEG